MTIPRVKRNQVWKIHWIRVCFLPGPPGLRCRERTLSLCQFVFKVKLTSLEARKRSSGIISVLFTVLHTPWGRVTATDFFFFFFCHTMSLAKISVPRPEIENTEFCAELLSRVRLFVSPWTVACQAPLSMGILQARILEWVSMPSSRGSSQTRKTNH